MIAVRHYPCLSGKTQSAGVPKQLEEGGPGPRREQRRTRGHARDDQLPGSESDFLALAIMIRKHLIDMRELPANIDLLDCAVRHRLGPILFGTANQLSVPLSNWPWLGGWQGAGGGPRCAHAPLDGKARAAYELRYPVVI
jgi:hypothetical protein